MTARATYNDLTEFCFIAKRDLTIVPVEQLYEDEMFPCLCAFATDRGRFVPVQNLRKFKHMFLVNKYFLLPRGTKMVIVEDSYGNR